MTTIHLNSEIDIESVIQGMGKLNNSDLEKVLSRISIMLAQKKAPNFPKQEAKLRLKINQSLDEAVLQRYASLNQLMKENKLSEEEHQELMQLIDEVELANAKRLKATIELANLRAITVDELMEQLNIHLPKPQLDV
jgi:hypothetical protein